MRLKLFVFLCLMLSPAPVLAAPRAPTPDYESLEIPRYGSAMQIVGLFRRPDGGWVLAFVYKKRGELFEGFYDVWARKRIAPEQEKQFLREERKSKRPHLERDFIAAQRLVRVSEETDIALSSGARLSFEWFTGTLCAGWPYSRYLKFSGGPDTKLMLLRARPSARKQKAHCGARFTVRVRYNEAFETYPDGNGGFYAVIDHTPMLIHFDGEGRSAFFDGRSDVVRLQADKAADIFATFADAMLVNGGALKPQAEIDRVEALIDAARAAQIKRGATTSQSGNHFGIRARDQ